jgi:hypothetical protein
LRKPATKTGAGWNTWKSEMVPSGKIVSHDHAAFIDADR